MCHLSRRTDDRMIEMQLVLNHLGLELTFCKKVLKD
jgi:hypothetical protein